MLRCLRVRSGRQGAGLKLMSESESLSRLSGLAPSFLSRACHFRATPISGHHQSLSPLRFHNHRSKAAIVSSQTRSSPIQYRRPKQKPPEGREAWSSQSTPADCRAWKVSSIKKSGSSRSFLVLYARTPLTIVAHVLSGRPVVVRPTLGAMGRSSVARYKRTDACLSFVEPADVHQIA